MTGQHIIENILSKHSELTREKLLNELDFEKQKTSLAYDWSQIWN
jgi:hypothetical protein